MIEEQRPDLSKVRLVEPAPRPAREPKIVIHSPFVADLENESDPPGDDFPPKDMFEADLSHLIDEHHANGLSLKEMRRSLRHWAEYLQNRIQRGER
jgi:hypothetical protein